MTPLAATGGTAASLVLAASGLTRRYSGSSVAAVDGVDLTIESGEVVAVLGPNGAGKTTMVKMCSGLLAPSSGTVLVDGHDPYARLRGPKPAIGLVLGGDSGFYGRTSLVNNLRYFADLAGVPSRERRSRVVEALEAVGLDDRAESKVNVLSKGMRQRLHIARGLLGHPRLLLLDEPTNGLDPESSHVVRRLVRDLAGSGTGILLTTHHLAEAEALADRIVVMRAGRIQAQGHMTDITTASGVHRVTTFSIDPARGIPGFNLAAAANDATIDVQSFHGRDHVHLQWNDPAAAERFRRLLDAATGLPRDFAERAPTLEECYLALVRSEGETA